MARATEALYELVPDGLIEVSVMDADGNETVYAAELRPLKPRKAVAHG